MENESKVQGGNGYLVFIIIFIFISIGASFYRYLVIKDFDMYIKETCDPTMEECLSEECDVEDPRCKPAEDGLMYYKETYTNASSIK